MTSSGGLESLITCDLLLDMARDATYGRGHAYAQDGRVRELSVQDGVLTARVEGSEAYRVRLFRQGTKLDFDCTCPMGNELRFCKHCVAAGLAWLMAQGTPVDGGSPAGTAPAEDSLERISKFLNGLDAPALRELLLAEARSDEALCERLLREAARAADPAAVKRLRAAIDRATRTSGFVDHDEVPSFAAGLNDVANGLAALVDADPAAAVQLAEHAIAQVESALGAVDDADGSVRGVLRTFVELHHAACLASRPEPVALAGRLFTCELETAYDTFSGAAETYAAILGEAGLAEYRRLAKATWDALPPLGPGECEADTGTAAPASVP